MCRRWGMGLPGGGVWVHGAGLAVGTAAQPTAPGAGALALLTPLHGRRYWKACGGEDDLPAAG